MDTPLISLIMPAYNCEATIGLAIETLAAQDYPVFELIVVDDGSSDSTPDIVEQLMARDSRIQLLRQEHASAGAARNTGMAHARGDYLLFVDADDAFEPTLLSTLYAASLVTGAEISMCNADCFLATPAQVVRPWNAGAGELAPGVYDTKHLRMRLFQCTTMVVWNKFFKADFISENNSFFNQ